jgi:hypothetical protein
VIDALRVRDPREDRSLFFEPVGWHDDRDGLAQRLGGAEPEQLLRCAVPGEDRAVESFADDRVVRRLHDRREDRARLLGFEARRDVLDDRDARGPARERRRARRVLTHERRAVLATVPRDAGRFAIAPRREPRDGGVVAGDGVAGDLHRHERVVIVAVEPKRFFVHREWQERRRVEHEERERARLEEQCVRDLGFVKLLVGFDSLGVRPRVVDGDRGLIRERAREGLVLRVERRAARPIALKEKLPDRAAFEA